MKHISETQLCLMTDSVHCCMLRLPEFYHQAVQTNTSQHKNTQTKNLYNLNDKQQNDALLVSKTKLAYPRVSECILTS